MGATIPGVIATVLGVAATQCQLKSRPSAITSMQWPIFWLTQNICWYFRCVINKAKEAVEALLCECGCQHVDCRTLHTAVLSSQDV